MSDPRVEVGPAGVRRPRQSWTPAVHAALARMQAAGITAVPAPLALDEDGELLSFLPGEAGADCWPHQVARAGLVSAARLLRRLHDATAGWAWPAGTGWAQPARQPAEVLCHGDPGPWNMTWVGGRATGLFDWDLCHPGPRRHDVAYALQWFAPFRPDDEAVRWHAFPTPPDRGARIRVFCAAYGTEPDGMVDLVLENMHRTLDLERGLAAAGVEPQATWVAAGHPAEVEASIRWVEQHRGLFT
ncbi:aminoglycoside phosphotransferase family protein [Microlunatus lacustris]